MLAIIVLTSVTLFFAAPAGLLVGVIAKKQKDADLLRFARPDAAVIPKVLPSIFVAWLLARRGAVPTMKPISAALIVMFFIEASLFAYVSYRYLLKRSARKKSVDGGGA